MTQRILMVAADELLKAVSTYYESGEYVKPFRSKDLADCVVQHSAAVGIAAMGAGVLPGAGAVVAVGLAAAAIWRMYVKICQIIKVPFGKNKLKAFASAVLTNIATQFAAIYAAQIVTSLIPGVGVITAGVINFASTYIAGLLFLMVLTHLFKAKRQDVEEMSDVEMAAAIKDAFASIDKKAVFNEAKNLFTSMRKDGSLNDVGKDVDISDEEEAAE